MKIRFSNNQNFSVEFEANDAASFRANALPAIRSYREHESHEMHRGEIHKPVLWFSIGHLHVQEGERWYNPGLIRSASEKLDGQTMSFFEPTPVGLPFREADSIDAAVAQDELWLTLNFKHVYQTCYDVWRWSQNLNVVLMRVDDAIRNFTDGEN